MKNWEKAYQDYLAGMKYKDIAAKYGVSINTVKSWKSRKWGASSTKKVANKKLQPVIENGNLTEQQKMFCLFYLQHFNATKAYQQAYQCDYKTANANGSRLLANASINEELHLLKIELQQDVFVEVKDIMREYVKQAFADITDYVEFGTKGKSGTYVKFKNSDEVDGSLIQEIKKGKEGVSVKLYDKQKAMSELMRYFNADDLRKEQIEKLRQENAQNNKSQESEVAAALDRVNTWLQEDDENGAD